jgi:hypothetical protein
MSNRLTQTPTGHWFEWIAPGGAALLAERLSRCFFVLKNHGPGTVRLWAEGGDDVWVNAGRVRATGASKQIRVENKSKKRVLIEFDFLPFHLK